MNYDMVGGHPLVFILKEGSRVLTRREKFLHPLKRRATAKLREFQVGRIGIARERDCGTIYHMTELTALKQISSESSKALATYIVK